MPHHYTTNYAGNYAQIAQRDMIREYRMDFPKLLAGIEPQEAIEREAVVREAFSWLGTPYVTAADVKGAGVDCGMLLVRVYVDAGICPPFDPRPYPEQWHMHQAAEKYMELVNHFATEVPAPPERPSLPGDVVLFQFGKVYSHGGIVARNDEVVHVYRPSPVQLERISAGGQLRRLTKKYFSVWPRRDVPAPEKSLMEYAPFEEAPDL